MRSKPPHGQGRDRQERKGPNKDHRAKAGAGRDHAGKSQGAKGHGGKDRGGKDRGEGASFGQKSFGEKSFGPRSGGPKRGGPKSGGPKSGERKEFGRKGSDRKESGGKEFGRKEFGHKNSGPKDFRHKGFNAKDRDHGDRDHAARDHNERDNKRDFSNAPEQKAPEKKAYAPRPERAPAPAPAPTIVGRIDHGGGAVDIWLYGHHPVTAALANQERRILRLLATPEALDRLRSEDSVPKDALNRARSVSRKEIDNLVGENAVHQGVAMLTRPIDHHLEDVLEIAKDRETCCVVLLDQVSDPHNVGAILRSAAAFNAIAVITLDRRAAAETGAMAKSASGALDRISFVQTTNLARAIEILKQNQFWVMGLEADGEKKIAEANLKGRIAFVMGTEGEGLRRLVRESCDQIVRLPINAASESLNVSNAAAIALYERSRQIGD